MKKLAIVCFAVTLLASASWALAQTPTAQNPWAYTPMGYFFGNQAVTPATGTAPATNAQAAAPNSDFESFFSLMPMFRFFNFTH